jgi:hypothetical protein
MAAHACHVADGRRMEPVLYPDGPVVALERGLPLGQLGLGSLFPPLPQERNQRPGVALL